MFKDGAVGIVDHIHKRGNIPSQMMVKFSSIYAFRHYKIESINWLMLNAQHWYACDVVMDSVRHDRADVLDTLILGTVSGRRGADVTELEAIATPRSFFMSTPQSLAAEAVRYGCMRVLALLYERFPCLQRSPIPSMVACAWNRLRVLEWLREMGYALEISMQHIESAARDLRWVAMLELPWMLDVAMRAYLEKSQCIKWMLSRGYASGEFLEQLRKYDVNVGTYGVQMNLRPYPGTNREDSVIANGSRVDRGVFM